MFDGGLSVGDGSPAQTGREREVRARLRSTYLVLSSLLLLSACSSPPPRIQSDDLPEGSLRVAQIVAVAKREDILKLKETYTAILAAGIADSDLQSGSVVVARIYCCGGISETLSSEYVNRKMLYVPKGIKAAIGDFVEVRVGRPPLNDDGGRLNAVTRVVAQAGDSPERCWWEPRNPSLWLRYPYCAWMPREGWVKQGGTSPAWYKPVP
jgi:hypothetical protein